MTLLLRFCLWLPLIMPLTGCVTHWHGKEMRSDILALRGQMDQLVDDHRKQKQELREIVNKLENRLQALNKHLEASLGALRTNSANSGSNLDEMRQTVQDLRGQLAELKHKLAQQDRDLNSLSPPTAEPLPKGRKALFNFASKRFEAGDCVDSVRAFAAFAERFPKDSNTDNALSYMGECQNQQGEYRKALRTLKQIIDNFPKGEKVDDALFLMHKSLVGLGKCKKAKVFLENMVENHPKSNRIKAARTALKSFGKSCP